MDFWLTLTSNVLIAGAAIGAVWLADKLSAIRKQKKERITAEQELRGIINELFYILNRISYALIQFHLYKTKDLFRQANVVNAQNRVDRNPSDQLAINELDKARWNLAQNDEQARFWRREAHTNQLNYIHISRDLVSLLTKLNYIYTKEEKIIKATALISSLNPIQTEGPVEEISSEAQAEEWSDQQRTTNEEAIDKIWVKPLDKLLKLVQTANKEKSKTKNYGNDCENPLIKIVIYRLIKALKEPW